MGTFFLLLSTWTNPHADDLEFPLKSFNPEQMHWFITTELWDHLSFCKQYVEPDSLFFFPRSTALELWGAQREMHSIWMFCPFAEQRPNSETIASFFTLWGFFPTLSWQARLKLVSISHSSYHRWKSRPCRERSLSGCTQVFEIVILKISISIHNCV